MNILAAFALLLSAVAAGWLLWRSAKGRGRGGRNVTLLKGVAWLAIISSLFAAKLMPLALMMMLAAGGVTAIELWREKALREEAKTARPPRPLGGGRLSREEAASVLGVAADADAETVRAAHRRLIAQLHPDKGGTDYLAAKINAARETLLDESAPAAATGDEA